MKIAASNNQHRSSEMAPSGFSLVELLITLTITLVILGLAFSLLARSLNTKVRQQDQASALSDASSGLGRMADEVVNAGFGLRTNGIVAGDSNEGQIRIRANLNALLKQTTSNTVTDSREDVTFRLTPDASGGASCLIRMDAVTGASSIVAYSIDDVDIDADGDGDGLTFTYHDAAGTVVAPESATRVTVTLRIKLEQQGVPGAPGFQPAITKVLTENIVLRNAGLTAY
jgi:prepilin-type N-terminal cleavage/methylation domain-containing protein